MISDVMITFASRKKETKSVFLLGLTLLSVARKLCLQGYLLSATHCVANVDVTDKPNHN